MYRSLISPPEVVTTPANKTSKREGLVVRPPLHFVLCSILGVLLFLATPVLAVKGYKTSNYGGGHQIWFEVEDFDERDPPGEDYYPVVDADGAFGKAINRNGRVGGRIQWNFDISKAGGEAGTWYLWVRIINPANASDFLIVEGHPGDPVIPEGPPYPGGSGAAEFTTADDRLWDFNTGPPWAWSVDNRHEGHTKQLRDGENTMYIYHRQGNNTVFWDVFMWTDDINYVPTDEDYINATVADLSIAFDPEPESGAIDVRRDVELSWSAGQYAASHDVYMGMDFDDVNEASRTDDRGVLVSQGQTDTTFESGQKLQIGTTYYWRIDEVNTLSDVGISKGQVWDFTTEPWAYPVTGISASASSAFSESTGPVNTVNGSGLNANDEHDTTAMTMWMTSAGDQGPWWIQFDLGEMYAVHEMQVWNHNQSIEPMLGFGAKDITLETSIDGSTWSVLEGITALNQATGGLDYKANTTVAFNGMSTQYVRMTIHSNFSGLVPQTGLSEVRFTYIPMLAREPMPADGAVTPDIDVSLAWRPGREAAQHEVILSTNEQAVLDGSALIDTVDLPYYGPGILDLGTPYFWRINEVNDAGQNQRYEGDLWQFRTTETRVIDDMELYKDEEFFEIWSFWVDGYGDAGNGSVVGNGSAPETVEVYEGGQSMPMTYDNSSAPKSETTRSFNPPLDLTAGHPESLNLYFKGIPYEFNGYYTQDGPDFWKEMSLNPLVVSMSDDALIGLALTSHDISAAATVSFSEIQTTGDVSGAWTQADIGGTHPAGSFSNSNGDITFSAMGTDIWDQADEFRYVYKQLSGEGSISAKVESLDHTHDWAKAGVMIRAAAVPEASFVAPFLTGDNGIRYQYRKTTGVNAASDTGNLDGTQELLREPVWIKIERKVANDAGSVYLVITDTSNQHVQVTHPDPAATRLGMWTQLSVPLTGLTGVNLSSVKSITVGVEGIGAIGKLYVDYLHATTPYAP